MISNSHNNNNNHGITSNEIGEVDCLEQSFSQPLKAIRFPYGKCTMEMHEKYIITKLAAIVHA